MSAARYKRSTSYPTGPNRAPEAETLSSFTELNPYGRWTVTIATSKTKAVGMLAQTTKAPSNKAKPPRSSVPIVSQSRYVWQRHAQLLQNTGKCIRASRKFSEAVFDEAIADKEAHWKAGPAGDVRSLHVTLHAAQQSGT